MIIDPLGIVPIERGGTGATTAEEAKEKLGIESGSGGTVLYSNSSGGTGTITLTDTYTNYSIIEIFYARGNYMNSTRASTSLGYFDLVETSITRSTSQTPMIYFRRAVMVLSSTSLSRYSESRIIYDDGYTFTNPSESLGLKIYRVIGYK